MSGLIHFMGWLWFVLVLLFVGRRLLRIVLDFLTSARLSRDHQRWLTSEHGQRYLARQADLRRRWLERDHAIRAEAHRWDHLDD